MTFLLNIPPVGAINTEVAPPLLHFSHEQQQRLQSSMKDNLFSGSTALLVVHRFHVLQKHPKAASFLCLIFFEVTELHSCPVAQDVNLKKHEYTLNFNIVELSL